MKVLISSNLANYPTFLVFYKRIYKINKIKLKMSNILTTINMY